MADGRASPDSRVARDLWHLFEPIHALVYFAPETKPAFDAAGLKGGWMGYFASRAAAMGSVPAEVVIATFYNFHPAMVRRAIPDAWRYSTPERVLRARHEIAAAAVRRVVGDAANGALATLRRAAEAADPAGRPLFAAHASLPRPDEPALALWHAATLLREHRGDGHVAALVAEGIGGCEAHVTIAEGDPRRGAMLRAMRGWSEDEWAAAEERLRARGLLGDDGAPTGAGREARARIERLTDELASGPFAAIGGDACEELVRALRPIVDRIAAGGTIPASNPIGVPLPTHRST